MNPDPLDRARALESVEAARELYDAWAERYDDDVFENAGVTGSRRIAELTADHVTDRDTSIVDLGCGTGAVGRALADVGFTSIVGIDLSAGMLDVARRAGAYHELTEADLNDPPAWDGRFGGAVSAGTFTTGHVDATAVPALLGLLAPDAWIVWAVAPSLWPAVETALDAASVTILTSTSESIRRGADDDRSHMVVGRLAHDPSH